MLLFCFALTAVINLEYILFLSLLAIIILKTSGVLNLEISNHYLTYQLVRNKISQYRHKAVSFRTTKALDIDKFKKELITTPWGVMDTFHTLADKCNYRESLFH